MVDPILQSAKGAYRKVETRLRSVRCPYEVLRTDKYDHIVCDDMFKLLVWGCCEWRVTPSRRLQTRLATRPLAQCCELIRECAQRHQVIFLTCKEEYADMLRVQLH